MANQESGKIVYVSLEHARECTIENIHPGTVWSREGEVDDPELGRVNVFHLDDHPGHWMVSSNQDLYEGWKSHGALKSQ